jgi:hypothetical protein
VSIVTPSALLRVAKSRVKLRRFDLAGSPSDTTGSVQTRVIGPPRWTHVFGPPKAMTRDQAALWVAMVLSLRGQQNHLALHDYVRPAPVGTMRGTMQLSALAAAGATTVTISTGGVGGGQATKTLLAMDKLTIGSGVGTSHHLCLTADATADASGVITITFEPATRIQFAAATPVTWDKPVAYYKSTGGDDAGWESLDRRNLAVDDLNLIENWNP